LMEQIRAVARNLGIVDISSVNASLWDTDPLVASRVLDASRPRSLMPSAESVIVIGIPLQPTILDTAPSIYYNQLYNTVNMMLDQASERIALELNLQGYDAVYIPRDGYHGLAGLRQMPSAFFSHRHAAYLAGMGTFGMNNTLLTPKNGPRIRFTSIITSANLPSSGPMSEDLCIRCKKCVRECPAEAISGLDYPGGIIKKQACVERSAELAAKGISPCGRCIAVCPVGSDATQPPNDSAIAEIRRYIKPKS